MLTETIYGSYGNSIGVILKTRPAGENQASAVDLEAVTRVVLIVGDTVIDSDEEEYSDVFDWDTGTTGEVQMTLGGTGLSAGKYEAWLITYDPGNPDSIVWGQFELNVVSLT
ncbi:MAG: hypothetical protein JRI86_09450 [Deltaproteobacteria bacterium]|nr:hypothetical protein [Deltaproteobacteria bacterium]